MKLLDLYKEKMKEQGVNVTLQGYKVKRPHYKLIVAIIVILAGIPNYVLIYLSQRNCSTTVTQIPVNGSASNPLYFGCSFNMVLYIFMTGIELAVLAFLLLKALKFRSLVK